MTVRNMGGGRPMTPRLPGKGPGAAVGRAAPGLQRGIVNRFNRGMGRGPANPSGGAGPRGPMRQAAPVGAAGAVRSIAADPRLPGRGPVATQMGRAQTAFGQAQRRPAAAPRGVMSKAAPLARRAPAARRPVRARPPARNRGRGGPGPWG